MPDDKQRAVWEFNLNPYNDNNVHCTDSKSVHHALKSRATMRLLDLSGTIQRPARGSELLWRIFLEDHFGAEFIMTARNLNSTSWAVVPSNSARYSDRHECRIYKDVGVLAA